MLNLKLLTFSSITHLRKQELFFKSTDIIATRGGREGWVSHPEKIKLDFQMTLVAEGVRNKNNFQLVQKCILK